MTTRSEMEGAIEAILLVATDPVPRERLIELFDEAEREDAAEALAAVVARHAPGAESENRGILLEEVAGGLRLATRPELNAWLRKFFEASGANKFSMASLETLAIIAYRQPITGPEIQELRSVSPAGVLRTLLEKRLIRIAGRKAVVGKPFLYGTTREFLMHFGLRSLADLPPLEEFEETFGEGGGLAAGGEGGAPTGDGGAPFTLEFAEPEPDREALIREESERLDEAAEALESDASTDDPRQASGSEEGDDPEGDGFGDPALADDDVVDAEMAAGEDEE
jgi:segregation and condensation protein B